MSLRFICMGVLAALLLATRTSSQDTPFEPPPSKPLSPREEQMTFKLLPGFVIELVASEPDVVDPVHLAFDEDGRLFVAEMRGYPNGGLGTGDISSGRIRLLEDQDGDGVFETSRVWAEGLRFPMGLQPYDGGVLVANAPDLIYLKDGDGDGRAEIKRVLYSGFDTYNIQQLLNSLTWGIDNWVYGVAGYKGGEITSVELPDRKPVTLRGRSIRFKPELPGSLEPTSGGGQYGLTQNDWGDWFVNTNSQHLRHVVLADHYLARNPNVPVGAVTLDIPDHGPACKVHRISPFEAWRVERTRRRKEASPSRFASTELVPGGFITSACSPLVYRGALFPDEFAGNVFVCDPANNLIHRDTLVPKGATYSAQRGDADCEFLASTDNWFRPVHTALGPDGALYIADFYREVIETPLSLPEDMKKVLPLASQGRGRIWRVRPTGPYRAVRPSLGQADAKHLVAALEKPNVWWRLTAQRLLVQRKADDAQTVGALAELVRKSPLAAARTHALWTLHGLGALRPEVVLAALQDDTPPVRGHALRVAEHLANAAAVQDQMLSMGRDPAPKVRHQLALSLGVVADTRRLVTLAAIARQDLADPWTQIAILASAGRDADSLFERFLAMPDLVRQPSSVEAAFLGKLAQQVGVTATDSELATVVAKLLPQTQAAFEPWRLTCLEGLARGLYQRGGSLETLWKQAKPGQQKELAQIFANAATAAADEKRTVAERLAALRLLSFGPFATLAASAAELLAPQQPQEVQLAAVRALATPTHPQVPELLLRPWTSYSPAVRREVTEALVARPERVRALLEAVAKKKVLPLQLEPARLEQLRKHPDPDLRAQAQHLLAGAAAPARQRVVAEHQSVLDRPGVAGRGKEVFKKVCSTCHRLENVGIEVGADLQSILPNKTAERLLIDILDPSREVDPRYLEYSVTTLAGRQINGLIVAETASSLTLRRAEKQEETILRSQIEAIQSSAKSLMPDGLETQLSQQDLADLIAYLRAVAGQK